MSNPIERGTTPTISYVFRIVDVDDIEKAYLTFNKEDTTVLERDITTATVNSTDNVLSWTLTQAETLAFNAGTLTMECNYRLYAASGNTRGASGKDKIKIIKNSKETEID